MTIYRSTSPLTKTNRRCRRAGVIVLACLLSGCLYWWRAYQVYLQLSDFDRYFSITVTKDFTLHFKEPTLFSEDFVSFAKLYPSSDLPTAEGRQWRYWFRKANNAGQVIKPEISFYCDLQFDKNRQLFAWTFSNLFLQIAPPKFLEVSLRSIGGAKIDKDKQQLHATTDSLPKITAELPKKTAVLAHLGEPLSIKTESEQTIYRYQFRLETPRIQEGFEDRALNDVQLSFDNKTNELTRMSGRFAGLKVSINYRKFLINSVAPTIGSDMEYLHSFVTNS